MDEVRRSQEVGGALIGRVTHATSPIDYLYERLYPIDSLYEP